MPRRLIDRCRPESIHEFRASARQRYDDGLVLAAAGNRTAAIYLWGYTAEMTLKAGYFSLIGFGETDPVDVGRHVVPAIDRGRALGIAWQRRGQGHNVRAWAELLIAERSATPGALFVPAFARQLQTCGQRIQQLWNETLRYHKNRAYLHELRQVREAASWLLANAEQL